MSTLCSASPVYSHFKSLRYWNLCNYKLFKFCNVGKSIVLPVGTEEGKGTILLVLRDSQYQYS
jgi:hypothetical protein